ncbi:MAG: site-specific integrase [Acidobacteria bacterium]|nr:site-specific integrase [Acidobacteriota bacterium]
MDNGLIPVSPCRNVKLPKITMSAMRILEPAETMALAEAIDERYRAMVLTAAYTGLRFGELAALRTERFDALRRTLRVEESLAEMEGQFLIKPPKLDASRRTVSVPSFVAEEMARHLAAHADETDLIFGAPAGGPIRRTNFRRRIWLPAVRASVGDPCTFHDLRHTHAALFIAQGKHPKVIQERLGHASIKTTRHIRAPLRRSRRGRCGPPRRALARRSRGRNVDAERFRRDRASDEIARNPCGGGCRIDGLRAEVFGVSGWWRRSLFRV